MRVDQHDKSKSKSAGKTPHVSKPRTKSNCDGKPT